MSFMKDVEELKDGLVLFRRTDVKHANWYCRVRLNDRKKYKTTSLKTTDVNAARDKAFDCYAEIRFKIKNELPIFSRSFSKVAKEFSDFQKERSEVVEISHHRWRVIDSHIRTQLNKYIGNVQIDLIGEDRWKQYATWRRKTGKGRSGGRVSDGTIRDESATFRSVMRFAASKRYIRESQMFRGKLLVDKTKREEFTAKEYNKLHTYARSWKEKGRNKEKLWYREVIYNFILIMCGTGLRKSEAASLRWSDCSLQHDSDERSFVIMNVWGKGKRRQLVAGKNVWEYLERIKKISKSKSKNDYVFTTYVGEQSRTLYGRTIRKLLDESGLLFSSSGS
ncbi:MAG: tyrosine-type recombinase/integrase, partial [Rhodospirillaceae bacterium]|nr:tyrosine-type recombinase/integrase [Rhodospirillaceae bacterium]